MKSCPECRRVYEDETFSFCLFDGTNLLETSDPDATQVLPTSDSWDSIITVVAKSGEGSFRGELKFDEISTDGVLVKKLSQYEDVIQIALKAVVKNLAKKRKEIFVEIQAIDSDGFELESYTLAGKLNPGEIKTLSQKFETFEEIYGNIRGWQIKEISQYD